MIRELFNGLLYVIRYGIAWRAMPNDLPPWPAVYQQSRRWIEAECFEAVVHDLRAVLRLAAGKQAEPTTAIIDNRTLRSTPESGLRAGYDGAKRKKGSKPHMVVDTLGHLLALHVIPTNRDDRAEDRSARASHSAGNRQERQAASGKAGFCIAAPTMDCEEIVRMGNTVQEAGERLRALRLNTCCNAHDRFRWLHAKKRSQPALPKCVIPSSLKGRKIPEKAIIMVQKAEQYPSNEIVSINLKVPKERRKVLKIFSYKNGITQVITLRKSFQLLKSKKEKKRS